MNDEVKRALRAALNTGMLCAVLGDGDKLLYVGIHEDCCAFMRSNKNWVDLRYIREGKLWRCASYVL